MSYSEHEKLHAIVDDSQKIGEFLEWLKEQGYILAEHSDEDLYPSFKTTENILAEYFEIDQMRLEQEKLQMLEVLRNDPKGKN